MFAESNKEEYRRMNTFMKKYNFKSTAEGIRLLIEGLGIYVSKAS